MAPIPISHDPHSSQIDGKRNGGPSVTNTNVTAHEAGILLSDLLFMSEKLP